METNETTFCNKLPLKIEIGVYYTEDENEFITAIDEDTMREEFESKLKALWKLKDE